MQDKKPVDESGHKLKPIIVTEKKIISLKKKLNEQTNQPSETTRNTAAPSPPKRHMAAGRKIPTATIHPEMVSTATTAVVKPVLKHPAPAALTAHDLDEYDEDELLADSPPTTPVRVVTVSKMPQSTSSRRVVVRADAPVGGKKMKTRSNMAAAHNDGDANYNDGDEIDVDEIKSIVQSTASSQHKGIFDRLDKKIVGVNDAAKRKIQRIVINNSE